MVNYLSVNGAKITVATMDEKDYISLTDMLKAKDGDFFISDWLRNRNTIEFLGIWEQIHNPNFNYGEFAIFAPAERWGLILFPRNNWISMV